MKFLYSLFFAVAAILCGAGFTASAATAGDRPATVSDLPREARNFLTAHYASNDVAWSTVDRELFDTTYEVALEDGTRIEFSRNGNWTDIKAPKGGAIPSSVIPAKIAAYVRDNYPKARIRQIETDGHKRQILLDNGVEILFDRHYDLIFTTDYSKHQPDHRFTLR